MNDMGVGSDQIRLSEYKIVVNAPKLEEAELTKLTNDLEKLVDQELSALFDNICDKIEELSDDLDAGWA